MHWFFILKWRMPENTEVIVCLFCFGMGGFKKIIKVEFSGTALR